MDAEGGLPSASLVENVRFNATVVVPNALQGIFRRRRAAVAAATAANVDGHAIGLLEGMARSYAGTPVWVRVVREPALLLLDPDDIARALDGSPDPFASDPKPKRDGMVHFQPTALTISRGEAWHNRRRFTEAALAGDGASGARVGAVCEEEADLLATGPAAIAGGELGWEPLHAAVQRCARRLILGDRAADDEWVSETLEEMMAGANSMPGEPADELDEFRARLDGYVADPGQGSTVAAFAGAPSDAETDPVGQLPHWLFAFGDTLAINVLRALVLVACHPGEAERCGADGARATAALNEAMRLWPTTTMLSRELTEAIEWAGESVPAGTQIVIANLLGHRNGDRLPFADSFAPEAWIDGDAAADRGINPLSSGPQGCPGAGLARTAGAELIGALARRGLEPLAPKLDPGKPMPQMLDFFAARVSLG